MVEQAQAQGSQPSGALAATTGIGRRMGCIGFSADNLPAYMKSLSASDTISGVWSRASRTVFSSLSFAISTCRSRVDGRLQSAVSSVSFLSWPTSSRIAAVLLL